MVVKQKWYQSKVNLVCLAALISFMLKTWLGYEIPGWDMFINLLMTFLMGVGIVNNGTNPEGFGANKSINQL